ncbi:IS4 family transposase [Myroides sp. N17-2]|uniref:IS4 family transposase n=1 Tax=Myroides sp. N17-2 TaxID=2030799 RepID=UPI000EFD2E26|nr:IS4 family transposase [Myroides sp. N17-2]
MHRKEVKNILIKLQNEINCTFLKEEFSMKKKDFTRKRKLTFSSTILFLINFLTRSLSLEIENFIKYIGQYKSEQQEFSKSAFVQARKKIKPEVFIHLNRVLIADFYTDNSAVKTLLEGDFRILSMDGSRITLPNTQALEQEYGRTTNNSEVYIVQAKACVLYDVLNKICLEGILSPVDIGERAQAMQLLQYCKQGDLLLYDRGYPSFELIHEHIRLELDYLMRVKVDFSNVVKEFVASDKKDIITEISPAQHSSHKGKSFTKDSVLKVRLIKVILSTGQIEVLMTSLLDLQKYNSNIFKELYFKRWGIETYYDELKNKLRVEDFSGYSNQSILQDFYSTILVSNIQSLIIVEINNDSIRNSTTKYQYKINTALSYGFLKDRILGLLFSQRDIDEILIEVKKLFKKNLVPIRPDRSNHRNIKKYKGRVKPKVTKNQKDTI